jgi:hypothetical protein
VITYTGDGSAGNVQWREGLGSSHQPRLQRIAEPVTGGCQDPAFRPEAEDWVEWQPLTDWLRVVIVG